jgi:hypothetical protein
MKKKKPTSKIVSYVQHNAKHGRKGTNPPSKIAGYVHKKAKL